MLSQRFKGSLQLSRLQKKTNNDTIRAVEAWILDQKVYPRKADILECIKLAMLQCRLSKPSLKALKD